LNQDIRPDGRKFDEFRDTLLNSCCIESADGSAMIKMGNSALICGIKSDLIEPKSESPDEGLITITVELPALCSVKYSSGVGNSDALVLQQLLQNVINQSKPIDLKKLCISEAKFVWNLNIEVICLNNDGNIIDCALIAILAALQSCSLQSVELNDKNEIVYKDSKIPLEVMNFPIGTTFSIIDGKTLCDPSLEEESLADSIINFVVNADNDIIHLIHKTGSTKMSINELEYCNKIAKTRSKKIKKLIFESFNSTKTIKK
jgi:exosome complex component RRP43